MPNSARTPLPSAVKMPLRDILRGVATVADVTEEILEPAKSLLPGPVRAGFRTALAMVDAAGSRAVKPPIDEDDIAMASGYARGTDADGDGAGALVRVLAFAWAIATEESPIAHVMFSETIAARSLAVHQDRSAETPLERTADILTYLRSDGVAGRFPGLSGKAAPEEQEQIDLTLTACFVWLLADRANSVEEEEDLFRWAFALTHAHRRAILTSVSDVASLAAQLESLANHL